MPARCGIHHPPGCAGREIAPGELCALAASAAVTASWVLALVFAAASIVGAPLARSNNPLAPGALALALASFVGSSAVQQLTLQSFALAASRPGAVTRGGAAFATAMFVLAHVSLSTALLYLANVALFALAAIALFVASPRRSLALPVGFHAG